MDKAKNPSPRRIVWRLAVGSIALLIGAAMARPTVHVARTAIRERALSKLAPAWGPKSVEDVSRLERSRGDSSAARPSAQAHARLP
jgi:hypothetical protein